MARQRFDWLAWWQLVRVANVFTALGNVIAGFLIVEPDGQPWQALALLLLSSSLLYSAGMVLNDVCDAQLDARERPERPIPAGRVAWRHALILGCFLLAGGVFAAWLAALYTSHWNSWIVAMVLAMTIISYSTRWKTTALGPWVMGVCRMMNVLLGASIAPDLGQEPAAWLWAIAVGLYTVGLTYVARHEVDAADRRGFDTGLVLILAGLLAASCLPVVLAVHRLSLLAWYAIWLLLIGWLAILMRKVRDDQRPEAVRKTVGLLISQFLVLDATACTLAAGPVAGLAVLSLLVLTRWLARWTPQS